ncbi:fluoride efflux transporter CrcB [Halomonas sp. 18H]|uniref:fluoride efflux transporter CrcB n=1 Tax=Halomonas almeriensis TaxID=308163 RepID=UPI0022310A00|nr:MULTISPECIES: fluoride efflux transporter CrcB [Halomonas]MCW4151949.1 fluoride efflux transporter CrcB [Halomonas sp. 18H]MDN3552391.1 fluoride efflux transporter CrcB [Halomonas almeriensis]
MFHAPTDWLLVVLGGALGGMARLAVTEWATGRWGARFPWGTLIVNLSGALGIGALAAKAGWPAAAPSLWLLLGAGLLGGFTTVSSFSLQTLGLWQQQRVMAASANLLGTLLPGIAAAGLGWWLMGGGP